jgi:hypothetical protein
MVVCYEYNKKNLLVITSISLPYNNEQNNPNDQIQKCLQQHSNVQLNPFKNLITLFGQLMGKLVTCLVINQANYCPQLWFIVGHVTTIKQLTCIIGLCFLGQHYLNYYNKLTTIRKGKVDGIAVHV